MSEMPVFVKIDEYKDVLDVIDLIRNKVDQAKDIMGKINELKKPRRFWIRIMAN